MISEKQNPLIKWIEWKKIHTQKNNQEKNGNIS